MEPEVWFAQSNLRAAEEVCRDEFVLNCLKTEPRIFYAESILAAVESLVLPAIRPPAMAVKLIVAEFLERRIRNDP